MILFCKDDHILSHGSLFIHDSERVGAKRGREIEKDERKRSVEKPRNGNEFWRTANYK